MTQKQKSQFEEEAAGRQRGMLAECWHYLRESEKWWLLPIVVVFVVLGLIAVLASTGAGPLLYALF